MAIWLQISIIISSSIFFIGVESTNSNITWWCNGTPHPRTCEYFIKHSHKRYQPKHMSQFRKITVQLALERALKSQRKVKRLRSHCRTRHEKTVWSDCLKLHANTVHQLNRTIQGLRKTGQNCTYVDVQTWLSTALTNIQTCRVSSSDLNVTKFLTPILSNKLSELISNSLAVNGVLLEAQSNTPQGFPAWFNLKERKLLQSRLLRLKAHLVVAKDGSGHFKTVQQAINAASRRRYDTRFIIHVKRGVYRENIVVGLNNNNIWLVGDGLRYTVIVSDRSVAGGYTTYSSATAGIDGLHFVARGITFKNAAGPLKSQAVALRSASDLSVFYGCGFEGYQDTLFVHSQRQFYKECYIYGTIDFIFGNAAVVFQNCVIYVRRPLHGQANVITAQGRDDPFQNTGISIHNSRILPTPDLKPVVRTVKTYLGRPWMEYSRTVVLKSYIDGFVAPAGWTPWQGNFALDTLYYGEYQNFGPGSSTSNRVKWKGFHVIANAREASSFSVNNLIAGGSWLPVTGVPFILGL